MVKLEMEVDGLPDWQTNMLNPDFAQVAEAMGMTGFNVSCLLYTSPEHRFEEIGETTGITSGESFATVGRIPIRSVTIRESLTATTESAEASGTAKATGLLPRFFLSFKLIGMFPMLPILVRCV